MHRVLYNTFRTHALRTTGVRSGGGASAVFYFLLRNIVRCVQRTIMTYVYTRLVFKLFYAEPQRGDDEEIRLADNPSREKSESIVPPLPQMVPRRVECVFESLSHALRRVMSLSVSFAR